MNTQKPYFHNAVIIAKTGASVFVVDENGNRLSDGYHYIRWGGHDNDWWGKKGAQEETFSVDTGKIDPWLSNNITLQEIIDNAADDRIATLAAYIKAYDSVPSNSRVSFGEVDFNDAE